MKARKKIQSYFLYGTGICKKCGTKDIRFTSKGNIIHHNGCFCRTALKPVGFLQRTKKRLYSMEISDEVETVTIDIPEDLKPQERPKYRKVG